MAQEVSEYSPARYSDAKLARVLTGKTHQHSHFCDVNGRDATFEGFDFSYCVFIRAYFHNATFSNCKFVGSHFIDCNFRNSNIRDCDFSYSTFNGTRIPTQEILGNLPSWPNVRREFLQTLRRNATSVGDYKSERVFVIKEIDSEKEHYRRAWRRDEPYYQKKYKQQFRWLRAGATLLTLKMDNFLWGHGERLWKSFIALVVILVVLSAVLTASTLSSFNKTTLQDVWLHFEAAIVYHVDLFLGLPNSSGIKGVLFLDWTVGVMRFLIVGVIVAALYRQLSHR